MQLGNSVSHFQTVSPCVVLGSVCESVCLFVSKLDSQPASQPASQSVCQSVRQSGSGSLSKLVESLSKWIDEWVSQTVGEFASQLANQWVSHSLIHSWLASRLFYLPSKHPVNQTITYRVRKPGNIGLEFLHGYYTRLCSSRSSRFCGTSPIFLPCKYTDDTRLVVCRGSL